MTIFRATGRDISLGPSPPGVRVDIIERTENSITWQETEMTTDEQLQAHADLRDMLAQVTGQLAALERSNASLAEKWRSAADAIQNATPVPEMAIVRMQEKRILANDLEAATKETTK